MRGHYRNLPAALLVLAVVVGGLVLTMRWLDGVCLDTEGAVLLSVVLWTFGTIALTKSKR